MLLESGRTWATIRDKLDCNDAFIDRWSKRFREERLAGLFSRHAGQEASTLTPALEARILEWTLKRKPPDGSTQWSTRKLGAQMQISHMMVARVWAKHGLKPHRLDRYMATNDPDFEKKAADLQTAATALADAAQANGFEASKGMVAAVRQTCGGCHRPYRRRAAE